MNFEVSGVSILGDQVLCSRVLIEHCIALFIPELYASNKDEIALLHIAWRSGNDEDAKIQFAEEIKVGNHLIEWQLPYAIPGRMPWKVSANWKVAGLSWTLITL